MHQLVEHKRAVSALDAAYKIFVRENCTHKHNAQWKGYATRVVPLITAAYAVAAVRILPGKQKINVTIHDDRERM